MGRWHPPAVPLIVTAVSNAFKLGKKIQNRRRSGLSFLQIERFDPDLAGDRRSVEFCLTVDDSRSYSDSRTSRKKACDDWHIVCFEEMRRRHSATAARNNLGCPTAREVGDSEEPPQGEEGTVRQHVGRLERGGRPGETESTTKPSGLERPLGFVRLWRGRRVSRRADARRIHHEAVKSRSLRKLCMLRASSLCQPSRCCRRGSTCGSLRPIWSDKP